MSEVFAVAQPNTTTLNAIAQALSSGHVEAIDVAAAYVTSSGARDLIKVINDSLGGRNANVRKRWITSFDYMRTQPVALEGLLALPRSVVKIHDADFCLDNQCVPKTPFHPKTFIFSGGTTVCALAGSGNVSRSGLSRGYEAGLAVYIDRSIAGESASALTAIANLQAWFDGDWRTAARLNAPLLLKYRTLYESAQNLSSPVPTDDDVVPSDPGRGGLTSTDVRKLRACESLWIEADRHITKNLGPHRPGNQLMMKRLSRVFFGFPSMALPPNSPIGSVQISYGGGAAKTCSLTYSDNGMDKLTLPLPGTDGPAAYDGQLLLFQAVGPDEFKLSIGTAADKTRWQRKSNAIGGAFKMSSGRQWGVF